MEQTFNLQRFLNAQNDGTRGTTYAQALSEIKAGYKRSHWVWYVFPQIKGIPGTHSGNAKTYAFTCREEAKAYWEEPVLRARMKEILEALLQHKGKDILIIMGSEIDALKLRSSMTIFYYATLEPIFKKVIDTFFHSSFDHLTTKILHNLQEAAKKKAAEQAKAEQQEQ